MIQSRLLARLLTPFTRYLGRQDIRLNVSVQQQWFRPVLAVVLARQCYLEQHTRYPITDLSALRKILANQTPSDKVALHFIGEVHNRQRQVQSFYIARELMLQYPSALFWLPESLLLGEALAEGQAYHVSLPTAPYFVARLKQHIVSAMQSEQLKSVALFGHAIGQPFLQHAQTITPENYATRLNESLTKLPDTLWVNCMTLAAVKLKPLNYKPYLLSTALVFTAYQLAFSGYIFWQKHYWQTKAPNPELNQLLLQTEQTQQLAAIVSQRVLLQQERHNTAIIWPLAAQMVQQQGVELQGFSLVADELTIRGSVVQATALLEWLRQLPQVSTVRLDAPLRTQNGREQFVIKLMLQGEA